MVAVSKLRRTQAGMQAMRPFADKSQEVLDALLASGSGDENRFIAPRKKVNNVCYVLFVGNRGLCGMYNSAVLRFMEEIAAAEQRSFSVVICGRWGKDVIAKSGLPVVKTFNDLSDTPTANEALELAEYLKQMYLSGEADEIHLVYQHYYSALRQEPVAHRLLPAAPESETKAPKKEFIFAPDAQSVLESVMQLYINNRVLSIMLEAKCGEHSARMTAMTSATDSTRTLIDQLGLSLNRARQAAITTEISEIVGGASALKRKKI